MEDDSDHQSVAVIGSNEDLLTEILIRLPVTSIFRFKSVSKHWRLLLTHTRFTHSYDNNNNNNVSKSLGLFALTHLTERDDTLSKSLGLVAGYINLPYDVEDRSTPPFCSNLDFYFNRTNVRIRQSCNGLLLCYAYHNDNGDFDYYVFNPTTKQLAFIPSVPKTIRSMALAYHQTHCVHYKVVCVRGLEPNEDLIQVQVYSSETKTWKICVESFSAPEPEFCHPVYLNGAIYWAPSPSCESSNFLYFKLDVEQLQMLPVPEGMVSNKISTMYFGESRGHLHLILRMDGILHVNVHEMLKDHSGWVVKYRVQLDELLGDFPCLIFQYARRGIFGEIEQLYRNDFEVVDVVRGKEEEDTFLVLLTFEKMIMYNVHHKSFKELYSKRHCFIDISSCQRYIETLSSF